MCVSRICTIVIPPTSFPGATAAILESQLRSPGSSVLGNSLLPEGEESRTTTSRADDREQAYEAELQTLLLRAQQQSLAHQVFSPAMTRVHCDGDDDTSFFGRAALQVSRNNRRCEN